MEFKSILNRFDSASMEDKENGPQKSFKEVTDKKEAEKIFKAAEKAAVTGLQLITGSRAKVSEEAEQLTFSLIRMEQSIPAKRQNLPFFL